MEFRPFLDTLLIIQLPMLYDWISAKFFSVTDSYHSGSSIIEFSSFHIKNYNLLFSF